MGFVLNMAQRNILYSAVAARLLFARKYEIMSKNHEGGTVVQLEIDGRMVTAQPGKSLLNIIRSEGMDGNSLSDRPLAAKIAGEIYTLNYIPVRSEDQQDGNNAVRSAIAAANRAIRLIRYDDSAGKEVYTRTAQFVLFLALQKLWPKARVKMDCTIGKALYIEVRTDDFSADRLAAEVRRLVAQDVPLARKRMATADAAAYFARQGQQDKARLLQWRPTEYFDVYTHNDFADYYYGELAPSTGYLQVWNICPVEGGFMFLFPDDHAPDSVAKYEQMPKFLNVSLEGERWCELMHCETVADLNELVHNGKIRELIRVNEALHEKRFSQVADMVCVRGARVVMLAGPSSSGKTTSANRLATQLRVYAKQPVLMSLDDYYIDRDKIAPGPDGKIDFEHINTIDTELFSEHLEKLLRGESVQLPSFDFKLGKRVWKNEIFALEKNAVIIVEGLHALNPTLLPKNVDDSLIFKLYVSPLIPLNLDDHNRIPTSLLRLLRRIVRDYETRGASVQQTISMWDSVRRGERRWIFPFQEQADMIFNSSTLYELAVLKYHIFPLLTAIQPEDSCYEQARAIVKILNYISQADVDDEIPPTSIVREFIGGNSFYR